MGYKLRLLVFLLAPAAGLTSAAQSAGGTPEQGSGGLHAEAAQIFALANQARAQAGVGPLQWDAALAAAALAHCQRMVAEGPIAHRYGGEPDVGGRAAQAGAHFSVIEENVAIGPSAEAIHRQWMQSPGHRSNMLSPEVDHVGVAVVYARGVLYAVADYSRAVTQLSAPQVEARVADLVRVSGVTVLADHKAARMACATDEGWPSMAGAAPGFIMRWQDADLTRLPQALVDKLETGKYRQAAVGSCPAQDVVGAFTAYRVAVLLY